MRRPVSHHGRDTDATRRLYVPSARAFPLSLPTSFPETDQALYTGLDDLCVRFIINLPEEDLSSVARICFQVEEAQWFYEDFIRPLDPSLPSMSLRTFCLRIFQHCPLLASFPVEVHIQAFEEFLQYKTRVPVRGAILLNDEMDSTVLVKGWKKGANWSFPRGKINKDEDDLDCAIREVWEETGLDLRAAGLVPEGKPKYIEITMREQQMRLYVFRNIPMDTHFQPQTRKEISKISWYKLSELPAFRKKGAQNSEEGASNANKFYMVAPFLVPLKKWVLSQKKMEAKKPSTAYLMPEPHYSVDETPLEEEETWSHAQAAPPVAMPPVVDPLQGATANLQRLLNLQPSVQPHAPQTHSPQDDRASALLSMLKSKDPGPEAAGNSGLPHTPLGLTTDQAPQPRNPHHHTNQRPTQIPVNEPPPQFPLHQHHSTLQWNTPQGNVYQVQQHQIARQAPLVHPQPLPPQVQRAMFNQSTFQENLQNQRPAEYAPLGSTLPAPNFPPAPQPHNLGTQTLALLNAFKKDTGKSPSVQPVPHQEYLHHGDSGNHIPEYEKVLAELNNPPLSELAGSSSQTLPANQSRPPGADTHRSALLGMFRSDQVAAKEAPKPTGQSLPTTQDAGLGVGSGMEKRLLDTLRRAPLASDPQASIPSKPAYGSTETSAALSDFLALKPRADQQAIAHEQPHYQRPSIPSAGANQPPTAHPIRILQRGQHPDGQQRASPAKSPQSHRAPTSAYASPANASSLPSPGSSSRRAEPSQDQKRQLLSLFGKKQQQQQQQPPPFAGQGQTPSAELAPGEFSRSRLASFASGSAEGSFSQGPPSRGATQTPISPADQTFLLDYLQSVTHNASTR